MVHCDSLCVVHCNSLCVVHVSAPCLHSGHMLAGVCVCAFGSGLSGPVVKNFLGEQQETGIKPGFSHTTDLQVGTPVATLPGSVLGLVGLVSVYCDWMR